MHACPDACPGLGRNGYLLEFVRDWEADSSLALRPNFAYATAMARFRLEQQQQQQAGGGGGSSAGAAAAAADAALLADGPAAQQQLTDAILLLPSVVPR